MIRTFCCAKTSNESDQIRWLGEIKMKIRISVVPAMLMAAIFLAVSFSYADKARDLYLGLNSIQKSQLKAADQAHNGSIKMAQQDKDSAAQSLMNRVLANAGDAVVQPILSQSLGI